MAAIVCQGLQSFLESQLVESRTWRLKLSSPKTHFTQPFSLDYNSKEVGQKCETSTSDYAGWNFTQAVSDSSKSSKEATEIDKPYIPPQVKSRLSEKSLELCTENLGSETGSDITDDSIFSMSSSAGYSPTREQQKPRRLWSSRKEKSRSFPPPLTTMSGSESLQVRPHREDGRLIIEAIKAPSTRAYFQAERSHGRLRLTLVKDYSSSSSSSIDYFNDADNEENEEELENDDNDGFAAEEGGVDEEKEEIDGNIINVGDEMGSENINQRPSRCKEGEEKNGLLNWEPYLVATS